MPRGDAARSQPLSHGIAVAREHRPLTVQAHRLGSPRRSPCTAVSSSAINLSWLDASRVCTKLTAGICLTSALAGGFESDLFNECLSSTLTTTDPRIWNQDLAHG